MTHDVVVVGAGQRPAWWRDAWPQPVPASHWWGRACAPRKSEILGSDLLLPAEAIEIRREAGAFADRVLRPMAHELNTSVERADGFRHDVFRAIAQAGL